MDAATLVLVGQYSPSLHRAYSLFWIIGTLGAIQFPVVGLAPVKSLEQQLRGGEGGGPHD